MMAVAPLAGARIETRQLITIEDAINVAPLAGARIETWSVNQMSRFTVRRSPRGSAN